MRTIGVLAAVIGGLLLGASTPAVASVFAGTSVSAGSSGITIGPMQINPVGHPKLCWQATGNGAPVELETCQKDLQNQQWSLTPDGVLINGIGYCLEALPGKPKGTPLFIDFASQCGGTRGQVWTYNGSTGQLSSPGTCAAVGGKLETGAQIVRALSCARGLRWSLGYSSVTLAAGRGSGPAGGSFSASVTVANAATAQPAYGTAVTLAVPKTLTATALTASGGAAGFRCATATATCTGTLPAGSSGQVTVSGQLPSGSAPGDSYTLTAKITVTGTSQQSGTKRTTASVKVVVGAAAPASATEGRFVPLSMPLLALIVGLLILGGGLLLGLAARRRPGHRKRGFDSSRAFDDTHPYRLPPIYSVTRPRETQAARAAPPLRDDPPSSEPQPPTDARPPRGERPVYDAPSLPVDPPAYEAWPSHDDQPAFEAPRPRDGNLLEDTRVDDVRPSYEGRRRRSGADPISASQAGARSGRHAANR